MIEDLTPLLILIVEPQLFAKNLARIFLTTFDTFILSKIRWSIHPGRLSCYQKVAREDLL